MCSGEMSKEKYEELKNKQKQKANQLMELLQYKLTQLENLKQRREKFRPVIEYLLEAECKAVKELIAILKAKKDIDFYYGYKIEENK